MLLGKVLSVRNDRQNWINEESRGMKLGGGGKATILF